MFISTDLISLDLSNEKQQLFRPPSSTITLFLIKKIVGGELYHFSNQDTSDLSFCLAPASRTGGLVPSLPG